ncbi:hypothetical protein BHE74_00016588 [Ensete ventricosum]|uniref:Uncharacterized protein n=1 Tax=Ensete ventricosum TaxID=4639 RepID=A0A444G8X5_ENSVE|nr:hypothetical protein GW17_00004058 [Ensete ventricosum]RWW75389.1 hypothetical protein BHE74_00016588 [Ensete ventricosum]RZR73321.1 hypothetical protein BHM03_00022735 [Ensete ventricosum]
MRHRRGGVASRGEFTWAHIVVQFNAICGGAGAEEDPRGGVDDADVGGWGLWLTLYGVFDRGFAGSVGLCR